MADVLLAVGGVKYGGWTSLTVSRSIDAASGTFELGATTRTSAAIVDRPIEPGQSCKLIVDGEVVVTGWVDEVAGSLGPSEHTLAVSGRDRTCDLVDCSAATSPGQWQGATLQTIATELVKPFGVAVTVREGGAPFESFSVSHGETVLEALQRMARQRGVTIHPTATGDLFIGPPVGRKLKTRLEEGQNVLSASGSTSLRERFSQYRVLGEAAEWGDTNITAPRAATVTDSGVKRYRPLVVMPDQSGDVDTYAARAAWEKAVRVGRGLKVTVKVQGWRAASDKRLWTPGDQVGVKLPTLGVTQDLVVASVRFSLDEAGTVTELGLSPAEAFAVEPVTEGT